MTYNLLIIFKQKRHVSQLQFDSHKTIKNVDTHGLNSGDGCFWFKKNGYTNYFPVDNVLYFGREFDYENKEGEDDNPISEKYKSNWLDDDLKARLKKNTLWYNEDTDKFEMSKG